MYPLPAFVYSEYDKIKVCVQNIWAKMHIESEVRPTVVQLKRKAKLPTVIGLTTKHAVCCNTLML